MYVQCRRTTLPEFKVPPREFPERKIKVIKRKDRAAAPVVPAVQPAESLTEEHHEEVPAWLKESLKNINKR